MIIRFWIKAYYPTEIVNLISTVAASDAISEAHKDNNRTVYTELEKIARVQSVKDSNAIEGIITADVRIKEIVEGNSEPLNHAEREIVGCRDVLDEIHTSHDRMSLSKELICHLHEVMTGTAGYVLSGQYKREDIPEMKCDEFSNWNNKITLYLVCETLEFT